MAFAVRTNVRYDASEETECPVPNSAISFDVKEFLHIKEVYKSSNYRSITCNNRVLLNKTIHMFCISVIQSIISCVCILVFLRCIFPI